MGRPAPHGAIVDACRAPFDEQGYLRTGDVFVIADGERQFLEYVDRAKDLVIRGGMNIAPAELESLPRNPVGKILKRELRDEIAKETA